MFTQSRSWLRGRLVRSMGAIALTAGMVLPAAAQQQSPGVVSHIVVLSDAATGKAPEDISSLAAWKKSVIKDGMDDQAKAIAIWTTVVKYRHQSQPPNEFLCSQENIHDPIKSFNVYGYGMCCCASANIEALARYSGMETRGWGITGHSVPEIKVNGHWGMYDASLINYFKKSDGSAAGVDEINKSIRDWLDKNPQYKNVTDHKVLYKIMPQWKQGPVVLAGGVGYDDKGWLPAKTHAWGDSIMEFGGAKNFICEYPSAVGYEVNIQLRPGEKLIRNWSNKGLHINQDLPKGNAPLTDSPQNSKSQLAYAVKWGDLTNGRVGNGTYEYDLPLASGVFRQGMLSFDNLACKSDDHTGAAVHVKSGQPSGAFVFRMPSSYVYLSGQLTFTPVVSGGSIRVSYSDNNGLDWKEIANVTSSGPQQVDLKPLVYRRYDYRLKFELSGAGTGLDAVKVTHDIQHSQRPLPILDKGDNHISFASDSQEGTITVEGNISQDGGSAKEEKNLELSCFHPVLENVTASGSMQGGSGTVTIPVQTPGEITRVRVGLSSRVRDAKDSWAVSASFDGGKTFVDVGKLANNGTGNPGASDYFVLSKVPAAQKSAQVRLTGTQKNTTILSDLRISVDYKEPHGGFAPVQITYAYSDGGQAKTDTHVAKTADDKYTIHCNAKPEMKSITLELAQ